MKYDAAVIGAGLSGLSCASLLAKRGLKVAVIEQAFKPGGSCGIFKRDGAIFDQGSAMLYGFGERGFNAHRYHFNLLEEPIDVIRHDCLYSVYFKGHRIVFHYDIDKYIEEVAAVFPGEKENFKRFYADMAKLYEHVMAETPVFSTPDELDKRESLKQVMKHPLSYMRFLSYMNLSTKDLLKKYFKNEDVLYYFNKLTSTYCYTDVAETPAVLAAVMFIDNHRGGSYYPAGSTLHLPGLLEKVIEENGGDMLYEKQAEKILIKNGRAIGVLLHGGQEIEADQIIYSGTVWNLYGHLQEEESTSPEKRKWAAELKGTYPSSILYALVAKEVIPEGTTPVTLFTESDTLDENEVTAYIFSIDDPTLCPPEYHTVMAIGPTFKPWPKYHDGYQNTPEYIRMKKEEEERLLGVMEKHFPGFTGAAVHKEVSTPLTIERYTMKNGGCVAGPLQSMGQHMLNRLHIRTEFAGLYCCGESTVMGTGTPTVSISGITAANAVLRSRGMEDFKYSEGMKNYVREIKAPYALPTELNPDGMAALKHKAARCDYCETPGCMHECGLDIRGINRRLAVGNLAGAKKLLEQGRYDDGSLKASERNCILNQAEKRVDISAIVRELEQK